MAKKNINPRCPLSGECERKQCEHINHELDCEYYEANGWGDNSIPDQDALREQEERKRGEKLAAGINNVQDKDLPALIYAGFGDDDKQVCCGYGSRGNFPEYVARPKLSMIYAWLERLGYEKSTEEIQLLNGEHAGYHAAEAYKEAASV